jgi:hypothetical protein
VRAGSGCFRQTLPVIERIVKRWWVWAAIWPLFFVPVALEVPGSPRIRALHAALAWVAGFLLISLRTAVRFRAFGVPLRMLIWRRRTATIPPSLDDQLPKLFWVVRNREPARAEALFLRGALLQPECVAYSALLTVAFTSALIRTAERESTRPETARANILEDARDAATVLPVQQDTDTLDRWADQLSGGVSSYALRRPVEFTAMHLASLVAIGAGAAQLARLDREQMYQVWDAVSYHFSHGGTVPATWQ